MITLNKMLLFAGLAVLLLTMAKIATAQPVPADGRLGEMESDAFSLTESAGMYCPQTASVPAKVVLGAHGLAIKGNETHILELVVESMRHVDPALIRRLLSSNKSLEEIKDIIRAEQGEETHRGAIRLDKRLYLLINIRFLPSEKDTTLDAEVALPGFGKALGDEIAVIGHMTVTIGPLMGERTGQGELNIAGGQQPGRYEVLLESWTDGPLRV
jgi:hypothetical protein